VALPFDLGVKGSTTDRTNHLGETDMKFMLIWRVTSDEAWGNLGEIDFDPAEEGVVVDFSSEPPVVTDGPYGETKELFNGFYLINVPTIEDAIGWAKRTPMTAAGFKTEIRRVPTIDEFPQDNEWIKKERAWRESTGQL
jgi:hypothetical protein